MMKGLLSKLRNKKIVESTTSNVSSINKNEEEKSEHTEINLNISSSLLALKGWPCDALGFCYHNKQCVFVVGTETGTLVCMGNDFQYTRTKVIDDSNEDVIAVRKILPIDDDKVLISNDDNSLVVLSVPSLEIIDIFDSTWLSKSYGNISFVYVDEPSKLNFVYIGTTRGFLIVLDITNGPIRVCDYLISLDEIGVESHMAIRAIQLCPQDDKFIAIAYRNGEDTEGAILIFDLVKKKPVKHYSTAPITTISWNHTGTVLFAGTVGGDVLKIDFVNFSPSDISMVWSYKEYYEDSIDFPVAIRNMQWLPSQDPTSTCLGCLFVSFNTSKEYLGELINCIIAIAEINGKVETIFELPKLYNEEVLDFCFVPTIEKDDNSNPVPALCVIFECDNDFDDSYIRVMKTIRCPMGDMNDWPLEIGLLPEPRLPCEILTSNGWVSSIFAMTSSSKKTLATLFLNGTEVHYVDKAIEKEFTSDLELSIDIETELLLSWNIVLSTGSIRSNKNEDVIILGHDNGEVTVWAISNLQLEEKSGLGVYWKKLLSINCGKDPITHINVDNEERLFIAGNSLGIVYVFDIFDVSGNIGHIDILRERKSTLSSPLSVPRAFGEDMEQNFCIREFSIIDTVEMVTCSLIISEFTTMFFGTKTGEVLACNDMTDESLIEIERIRDFIVPANEKIQNPVTGLVYGAFYRDKLIPVCYVHYKSGHICAIDVHTLEVIAYHYAPLNDEADIYSKAYSKAFGYLLDSDYNIMSDFNTLEIIKESFSVGSRSRGSSVASRESTYDNFDHDAPPKPPKPPKPIKNSFFSVVSSATEKTQAISIPPGAPRYLMLVVGKYIVMHDLSRLAMFDQETGKFGKVDILATSVISISKHLIINSSTITIDYNGENMEILTIQLFDGRCLLFNPHTRKCIATCNLLENVEDKYIVENGIFLKNGNCYLEKNGCFIISSNVKLIGNKILNYPLSDRVKFSAILPKENFKLDNGRSKSLEAKKIALQKRRQSIITITAGPTDLTKLFSKSRSSLSTNLDEVEEVEVEMRGYSPRSVRKKHAAFGQSPLANRNSNHLSKTSMLLLQMNEEMKPEARNKQKEVIEKNQQEKGMKLSQKQEQRKEALELLKEAQHYNKFEKNTSLKQGAANQSKMNETKILLEQRGMKLERSTEKSEETMNAAKQYRDALAEQKKILSMKASRFW